MKRSISSADEKRIACSRITTASARVIWRMTFFTIGIWPAVIENSSRPSASSTMVSAASPAISPHIATGMLAPFAARMMASRLRKMARCNGR